MMSHQRLVLPYVTAYGGHVSNDSVPHNMTITCIVYVYDVPPPFSYVRYGKRHTLPRPTAKPTQVRMNSSEPPQPARSGSSGLMISTSSTFFAASAFCFFFLSLDDFCAAYTHGRCCIPWFMVIGVVFVVISCA